MIFMGLLLGGGGRRKHNGPGAGATRAVLQLKRLVWRSASGQTGRRDRTEELEIDSH
jgi:hypothetical protein